LLPELSETFDLVAFTFGSGGQVRELQRAHRSNAEDLNSPDAKLTLKDFPWVNALGAVHSATAMGDSLREVINRKRGQSLAGIWVISDGAHNSGVQPRTVGSELSAAGVPLYFYAVGITSPRDIIITEMDAPQAAFLEDELLVRVRVRSQGLEGKNAQLVLTLNGETVAEETIPFGKDGERRWPLRFKTNVAGEFDLRAHIAAREDETDAGNTGNQFTRFFQNAVDSRFYGISDLVRVFFRGTVGSDSLVVGNRLFNTGHTAGKRIEQPHLYRRGPDVDGKDERGLVFTLVMLGPSVSHSPVLSLP